MKASSVDYHGCGLRWLATSNQSTVYTLRPRSGILAQKPPARCRRRAWRSLRTSLIGLVIMFSNVFQFEINIVRWARLMNRRSTQQMGQLLRLQEPPKQQAPTLKELGRLRLLRPDVVALLGIYIPICFFEQISWQVAS